MKRSRILIIGVVLVAAIIGVLTIALRYSYVTLDIPAGQTALLQRSDDGTTITKLGSGSHKVALPVGTIVVHLQSGDHTTDIQTLDLHPGSAHPKLNLATTNYGAHAVVASAVASLVASTTEGTYYLDRTTRDVIFTSTSGTTTSLSASLNLATSPVDNTNPIYDTAFAITAINNQSVVISTTLGVFIVTGATNIQSLPTTGDLNFSASAYDSSNHHLYLLASDSKTVYSYDVGRPNNGPVSVMTAPKQINRIVAGGGKIGVYFDNIAAVTPGVVNAFTKDHQVKPLIYTVASKKTTTLSDAIVTTGLWISADGSYIATKQKFATTMIVRSLTHGTTYTVPAPDSGAAAWIGNNLYIGYGDGVWSYSPGGELTHAFTVGTSVAYLTSIGTSPLVVTSDGIIAQSSTPSQQLKVPSELTQPTNAPIFSFFSPNNL